MKRTSMSRRRSPQGRRENSRPSLEILEERLQPGEALFSALANVSLIGVSLAAPERPAATRETALTERLPATSRLPAPVPSSPSSENHSAPLDRPEGQIRLFRTDAPTSRVPGTSSPGLEGPLAVGWVADLLAAADPFAEATAPHHRPWLPQSVGLTFHSPMGDSQPTAAPDGPATGTPAAGLPLPGATGIAAPPTVLPIPGGPPGGGSPGPLVVNGVDFVPPQDDCPCTPSGDLIQDASGAYPTANPVPLAEMPVTLAA